MAREFNESDHPRHPKGSGDKSGEFREKIGGGGWAERISDAIGRSRGGRTGEDDERSYRRLSGGDRDLLARAAREGKIKHHSLDGNYSFARQRALVDPGYLRATDDGAWEITEKGRQVVARDTYNAGRGGGGDPRIAGRRAQLNALYDELGIQERDSIEEYLGALNTDDPALLDEPMPLADLDYAAVQHLATSPSSTDMRNLRGRMNAERFPTLAREIDDLLGPATRDDYNREIIDEARAAEFENRAEGESDEELVAQIRITETLRQQGRTEEWDKAVDHLRGMLTISYMDDSDLPVAPRR